MERRPINALPAEDNEYHSQLEFDDTVGWHVYVVPGLAFAVLVGVVASIIGMQ
jgi:hypothetical protein